MDKAFEVLIESISAQLFILNNNGYAIYDAENRDYFISSIRYDRDDDKIVFETLEESSEGDDE